MLKCLRSALHARDVQTFYMGSIAMCRILKDLAKRRETERMAKIINRTAAYLENAKKARRLFWH